MGEHKRSEKKNADTANLPKYLAYVIVKGKKIGYQINNFPLSKTKKIKRKFCNTTIPMEEKYRQAVELLKELWDQKNKIAESENNNSSNDKILDELLKDDSLLNDTSSDYSTDDDNMDDILNYSTDEDDIDDILNEDNIQI